MLQAYIDDSGNVPEQEVFVLGGLISTCDRWLAFSDEWKKALQLDPPLRYFNSEARPSNIQRRQNCAPPSSG
jgi:hypothetical protein